MEQNTFTGCLIDPRPEVEKLKDWQDEEIFAQGAVVWEQRKPKSYPIRNQFMSSSCVAQTLALMLSIENEKEEGRWVEFSASDIYQRRQNKGYGGMIGNDALEIVRNFGATLEVLMPSQMLGESEINAVPRKWSDDFIGGIFRTQAYFHLPFNIERIAGVLAQGHPVMTWFMFPRAEWTAEPRVTTSTHDMVHHSVTAVDYVLRNGKKFIVIQDSWGLDRTTDQGLRYISEEYIKSRMTFCAYINDAPNNWRDNQNVPDVPKPTVKLSQTLKMGSRGDEVKQLQQVLKYEELFPQNATQDGIFGAITHSSVVKFQKKHGLGADGIVGKITRSLINKIYG
jgi:hypothetical protein